MWTLQEKLDPAGLVFSEFCQKVIILKKKSRSRRQKKTTKRQDREIFRLVSTQKLSVRSISKEVTVPVSKSTMHRRLQVSKLLAYRKMRRSPKLTTRRHKDARVHWARNHMNWTDEWMSIQ